MELNEWICAKKKANGLCFYMAIMKLKKTNPISFDSLLQLDSNLIGLSFFKFIMALVNVKSISLFLCTNSLI